VCLLALDVAVARTAFRRYASYRAATISGIITNSFWGVLLTSVVLAVTRQRPEISGYSEQELVTQVWVAQGLLMTIAMWGWVDIGNRIRTGEIAIDLYRPVDLQRWWLAHDLGRATYQFLIRGTAPFLVACFLYDVRLPTQWTTLPFFVVSVALANTVSFALRFLVNLTAFWLQDVRGTVRLAMAVWTAGSGSVVSLALFPDLLERVLRLLPFAQMTQAPVDVWIERGTTVDLVGQLALQAAWAIALLWCGRLVLARGRRVAVVQGG
jgi:ABC-2 type transport system permease protein